MSVATRKSLPPGVTARTVLVRHGEPHQIARGRCYGKLDVSLSAHGRAQIERAAVRLNSLSLAAVYASPRRRARESAEIIAAAHHLAVRIEEDFGEINFGDFEGLTYDEVAQRYPREYRQWMEHPTEVTFPGGESFAMMRERVAQAAAKLRAQHLHETIAIISHGGVNRVLLAEALRMNAPDIFRLEQSYAGVSIIDYYDATPTVRLVNGGEEWW